MYLRVLLLIFLISNLISCSIEIQDDGVFSEIQEIEVKNDNIFEEIILVRTTKKVKKDEMQRDNPQPKVNIENSDEHETMFDPAALNPFSHLEELASGLSEASIGTMAACFLFIALCCLSCTTGLSVKKLELNNLFKHSLKLKLLLSPYVKQCFYMCFMDKINFPETLTREMSEIVAKNPHKYAHLGGRITNKP